MTEQKMLAHQVSGQAQAQDSGVSGMPRSLNPMPGRNQPEARRIHMAKRFKSLAIATLLAAGVGGLGSVAHASDALEPSRLQFGINLNVSPSIGVGFTGAASFNNLAVLAPGVGFGVRADVSTAIADPFVAALGIAPVLTFAFQNGGVYVGPSFGIGIGAGDVGFGFGIKSGIEYDISSLVMLYANLGLNISPDTIGNISFGATYELSRSFSLFGQGNVTFASGSSSFGIGAGAAFRI
jgi:hypothetical protein